MSSFRKLSFKTRLLVFVFFFLIFAVLIDLVNIVIVQSWGAGFDRSKIAYNVYTHHDYIPNSSFVNYPRGSDTYSAVKVKINSFGIRGPAIKKKTCYRVLMLGDSFIQADEVKFKKTFSKRLNDKFRGKIEFLAHGISSWSPTLELSWLYHKGVVLDLDEVNLFLCINDFGGDTKYRNLAKYKNGIPIVYKVKIPKRSFSQEFLSKSLFCRLIDSLKQKEKPQVTFADDIDSYCRRSKETWKLQYTLRYEDTIKSIREMASFLRAKKIKLTVYLAPMGYAWKDELIAIRNMENYALIRDEAVSQTAIENYLALSLAAHQIEFKPLENVFASFKKRHPRVLLFNSSDGHWNANGHEVLCRYFETVYGDK